MLKEWPQNVLSGCSPLAHCFLVHTGCLPGMGTLIPLFQGGLILRALSPHSFSYCGVQILESGCILIMPLGDLEQVT